MHICVSTFKMAVEGTVVGRNAMTAHSLLLLIVLINNKIGRMMMDGLIALSIALCFNLLIVQCF